jgi:hypothetical protein
MCLSVTGSGEWNADGDGESFFLFLYLCFIVRFYIQGSTRHSFLNNKKNVAKEETFIQHSFLNNKKKEMQRTRRSYSEMMGPAAAGQPILDGGLPFTGPFFSKKAEAHMQSEMAHAPRLRFASTGAAAPPRLPRLVSSCPSASTVNTHLWSALSRTKK